MTCVVDFFLQIIQELCGVGTIHLGVVELEGNLEGRLEEAASVLAPNEERIVEDAAIHTDCAVDVVPSQSRCADNHAVGQVVIATTLSNLPCELQVTLVEEGQVLAERNVA